jgi:hypothetical protein
MLNPNDYKLLLDEEIPEGVEIPEDQWAIMFQDRTVIIHEVHIDFDNQNEEGNVPVHYSYDILNGEEPSNLKMFEDDLGAVVMQMVEDGYYAKEMKRALAELERKKALDA